MLHVKKAHVGSIPANTMIDLERLGMQHAVRDYKAYLLSSWPRFELSSKRNVG